LPEIEVMKRGGGPVVQWPHTVALAALERTAAGREPDKLASAVVQAQCELVTLGLRERPGWQRIGGGTGANGGVSGASAPPPAAEVEACRNEEQVEEEGDEGAEAAEGRDTEEATRPLARVKLLKMLSKLVFL
jgi:hypothetical protein